MGSHGDPHKWAMPGWRIEQRYSPGVLIGNWGEEKHQVCLYMVCGICLLSGVARDNDFPRLLTGGSVSCKGG